MNIPQYAKDGTKIYKQSVNPVAIFCEIFFISPLNHNKIMVWGTYEEQEHFTQRKGALCKEI